MEQGRPKSEVLADFVHGLTWEAIPAEVRLKAKCHLLDTVGVAFAGAAAPSGKKVVETLYALDGNQTCTVIGSARRLSAPNAALVNGIFAHTYDYDDTHWKSLTHPSGVLVPALFAAAEQYAASGRDIVTAMVAGCEVMTRMGLATHYHQIFERGYQPTTLLGCFGAAAAVARLMRLSAPSIADALGFAASQASGIRQFSVAGEVSLGKRFHSGWPAHSGVIAAHLAAAGLTAPRRVLEGQRGLYRTHLGEPAADEEALVRDLGVKWETLQVTPKVHSGAQIHQPFMDLVQTIAAGHGLQPDGIERLTLHIAPDVQFVCEPLAEKRHPKSHIAALLALPFCSAVMVCKGAVGPHTLTDQTLRAPDIAALADRVYFDNDVPPGMEAAVTIITASGKRLHKAAMCCHGAPEDPLSEGEYRKKYTTVSAVLLAPDRQKYLADLLMDMDDGIFAARHLRELAVTA